MENYKNSIGQKIETMQNMSTAKNQIIHEQKKKIDWLEQKNDNAQKANE